MTDAEAEIAAEVHAEAFAGGSRPWSAEEFRALAACAGVFVLIEPDALLVGRVAAEEAEIVTLAVRPAARRRGLGRSLLARFDAQARRRGAEVAFLEVSDANAAACALYRSAGWREVARRPGYYRHESGCEDAIVMKRALSEKNP
jgi:ribosomal-protein-alanine N-acetyltransferase